MTDITLHWVRKSFRLDATLRANALFRRYEGNSGFRFHLQPGVNAQYDFTGLTSAFFHYSYRERDNSLLAMFRTPVFTSYRTQASHTGDVEDVGMHTAYVSLKYQQPIKGLFGSIQVSWTRRTNEALYQSVYEEPVYKRTFTGHYCDADAYLLSGSVARSWYWGKTLISLDGRQMWSNYYLWQKDGKVPWQMRDTEITCKLSMQPVRMFSYELYSRMQLNQQVNRANKSLSSDAIRTFSHALSLFLFPFKGFQVGLKSEVYHSSDKSVSANFFTDAHCSWQFKRYELRLACNNLLGNHRYERRLRTSVTDVYSVYRLRPREVLLAFSMEF